MTELLCLRWTCWSLMPMWRALGEVFCTGLLNSVFIELLILSMTKVAQMPVNLPVTGIFYLFRERILFLVRKFIKFPFSPHTQAFHSPCFISCLQWRAMSADLVHLFNAVHLFTPFARSPCPQGFSSAFSVRLQDSSGRSPSSLLRPGQQSLSLRLAGGPLDYESPSHQQNWRPTDQQNWRTTTGAGVWWELYRDQPGRFVRR